MEMQEAIATLIYCAKRIDAVPEFVTVANLFAVKFGKEWAQAHYSNGSGFVNPGLLSKMSLQPPTLACVIDELKAIAAEANVDWEPQPPLRVLADVVPAPEAAVPQATSSSSAVQPPVPPTVSQLSAHHYTPQNSSEQEFPYGALRITALYRPERGNPPTIQ